VTRRAISGRDGFTVLELTIAMALTLALVASIISLTRSAGAASARQGEAADLQQRLRVGVDTIARDLMGAGAGPYLAGYAGPLSVSLPAVLPFRASAVGGDPPGTFRNDIVTLLFVPATAAQTTLTADMAAGSDMMQAARLPICAAGENLCGFAAGTTILAFDDAGTFQLFTVFAVVDGAMQLQTAPPAAALLKTGAAIVEVQARIYALKSDAATRVTELVRGDGTARADVPVLDHVVEVVFDYGVPPAELIDGPWRPDAASPGRWDADLVRIRTVGVTIRIESALAALRGPAGALFARAGTATDPRVWVPDQEVQFHVSPRNLSLRR
jgi:Tfp pilus assembly protein PilW